MSRTFGIIGLGNFGCFLGGHLSEFYTVYGYDPSPKTVPDSIISGSLEEVAGCDYIIFAVPVQNLEQSLHDVLPFLKDTSVLIDVSSVKVYPQELFRKYVPVNVPVILTHPLFGPSSGKEGISGLPIVMYDLQGERFEEVRKCFEEQLWLKVLERDPEAHDKEMAYVQALTHYMARGLGEMGISRSMLATKSYQHLFSMQELLEDDSWELFETIENWNPYARSARKLLMEALVGIEEQLGKSFAEESEF